MAQKTNVQEVADTFLALRQKWEAAFPSSSPAVQSLRDALVYADFALQHSLAACLGFHTAARTDANKAEPYHLWPSALLRRFNVMRRQHAHDTRHFTHTLRALQSACAAEQPPKPKAANHHAPAPPPVEPDLPARVLLQQMVKIRVENDQVTTTVDLDAAFWCRVNLWDVSARFTRHFHFINAVIPEQYSYVLTHDGVTYPPAPYFSIAYSSQEFARLCQLELDTLSPHLLDGERLSYDRRESSIEQLRADYFAKHKQD